MKENNKLFQKKKSNEKKITNVKNKAKIPPLVGKKELKNKTKKLQISTKGEDLQKTSPILFLKRNVKNKKIKIKFLFIYKKGFFQKKRVGFTKKNLLGKDLRLDKIKKAVFLYIRRKKFKKNLPTQFSIGTLQGFFEFFYRWKQKASVLSGLGIFPVKGTHFEFSYRLAEGIVLFSPQKFYTLSLVDSKKL